VLHVILTVVKANYDVAILGLGAMGSAAAHELARRGVRVIGFDRYAPPHALGSTHGRTRIIREAYFEHPAYVPLVRRAYERWAELEEEAERPLFRCTGGVMVGPAEGMLVSGALCSAKEHGLDHELLSAAELRQRFPLLAPPEDAVALFEPRAGLLFPEACVESWLSLAGQHGAEVHVGERALHWESSGDGVRVETTGGTYGAAQLLVAAGPWLPTLVPELGLPLEIERQMFHWFAPARASDFAPDRFPIGLWEYAENRIVATFPDVGDGVKIGVHHEGEPTDPDRVRREVSEGETARARALLARLVPAAAGPMLDARVCLYTNTPDHHFLIDFHPQHPQVLIASPCSGHGFKFASAIGEVLADLLLTGRSEFDLSLFRLDRATL
jgi:sarcosine oxidase